MRLFCKASTAETRSRAASDFRRRTATGAGVESFPDHLIGVGDRQDDDLEMRVMLKELASRVQTVQVGHADVDDDDIRIQLQGLVDRFTAIACLAADLPTLMLFKKCAQAAAHDFVVVC